MKLIVRTDGERTAAESIKQARLIGDVDVLEGYAPFVEVLRATYKTAYEYNQDWIPVIDADVLLSPGTIIDALKLLQGESLVFCLDGRTKDKILAMDRRAGIHIYYRPLLSKALDLVEDSIKPETRTRQAVVDRYGAKTIVGNMIFGLHDYEQYYRDLWRKAFLQTQKLAGMMFKNAARRSVLAQADDDYRVICAAHEAGLKYTGELKFDVRETYGAEEAIKKLGLQEKKEYGKI